MFENFKQLSLNSSWGRREPESVPSFHYKSYCVAAIPTRTHLVRYIADFAFAFHYSGGMLFARAIYYSGLYQFDLLLIMGSGNQSIFHNLLLH